MFHLKSHSHTVYIEFLHLKSYSHSFHRVSSTNEMGYNKCSVAGCVSKPGVGKVFKQLPKNPDLEKLWLQSFPQDLRVTKSLAICEVN